MSEQSNEPASRLRDAMQRIDETPSEPRLPGVAQLKAILEDRGRTHGNFSDNAACSQDLKSSIRNHLYHAKEPHRLEADQVEALEMICLKISRIVTGDPNTRDHWDDISGYAQLIARRL